MILDKIWVVLVIWQRYQLLLLILNQYMHIIFASDNLIKSYNSYHFLWRLVVGWEPSTPPRGQFFDRPVWPADQNSSMDPYRELRSVNETFASIWNENDKLPIRKCHYSVWQSTWCVWFFQEAGKTVHSLTFPVFCIWTAKKTPTSKCQIYTWSRWKKYVLLKQNTTKCKG